MEEPKTINHRDPNFQGKDGVLYLDRCYNCDPVKGKLNWIPMAYEGECVWCGWKDNAEKKTGG